MYRHTFYRRAAMLLLIALLALSATGCWRAVETARDGAEAIIDTAVQRIPTVTPLPPTATTTHTPTATATPLPSATPTAAKNSAPQAVPQPTATTADSGEFTIELTEEQLNGYLNAESFSAEGVTVSDVNVQVTPQELAVTLRARQPTAGLDLPMTLYGKPKVVDGTIYVEVTDVELDESVRGFTRLFAEGIIEAALAQYAEPHGIPINIEGAEVTDVQLAQDKLIVKGHNK